MDCGNANHCTKLPHASPAARALLVDTFGLVVLLYLVKVRSVLQVMLLLDPNSFLGKEVRKHSINDIDIRSQVTGKHQTHLLNNGRNLTYPPSTQVFQSVDMEW